MDRRQGERLRCFARLPLRLRRTNLIQVSIMFPMDLWSRESEGATTHS